MCHTIYWKVETQMMSLYTKRLKGLCKKSMRHAHKSKCPMHVQKMLKKCSSTVVVYYSCSNTCRHDQYKKKHSVFYMCSTTNMAPLKECRTSIRDKNLPLLQSKKKKKAIHMDKHFPSNKDLRKNCRNNNVRQFSMWKRNYIINKQSLDEMTP